MAEVTEAVRALERLSDVLCDMELALLIALEEPLQQWNDRGELVAQLMDRLAQVL